MGYFHKEEKSYINNHLDLIHFFLQQKGQTKTTCEHRGVFKTPPLFTLMNLCNISDSHWGLNVWKVTHSWPFHVSEAICAAAFWWDRRSKVKLSVNFANSSLQITAQHPMLCNIIQQEVPTKQSDWSIGRLECLKSAWQHTLLIIKDNTPPFSMLTGASLPCVFGKLESNYLWPQWKCLQEVEH